MPTSLPIIAYKGKKYFVDFRLGEMRGVNERPLKIIRFTDLKEGVQSPIKQRLRALRSKTWHNDYVQGIDD